jgi:hypothetical protein
MKNVFLRKIRTFHQSKQFRLKSFPYPFGDSWNTFYCYGLISGQIIGLIIGLIIVVMIGVIIDFTSDELN